MSPHLQPTPGSARQIYSSILLQMAFKHVYTSTQEIYEKTNFLENLHLKIIYNFYNTSFLSQTNTML
jgi:hypothetical protein